MDAPAPPVITADESRPLSGMAITSLVFGLLACLPGAGLLGIIFGLIGIAGTGANGVRRGRGIAVSGTVLSLVSLIGQIVVIAWLISVGSGVFHLFVSGPEDVMKAAATGDRTVLAEYFFADEVPSDAELAAFLAAVTAEAGTFQRGALSESVQPPMSPSPGDTMDLPYVFEFDKGSRTATVSFVVAEDGRTTKAGLPIAIRSITIMGSDGSEFTLTGGVAQAGTEPTGTDGSAEKPSGSEAP
jgi:hypothetical protein